MSLRKDIIEAEFRTKSADKVHREIAEINKTIAELKGNKDRLLLLQAKEEAAGRRGGNAWKAYRDQIKAVNSQLVIQKARLTEQSQKLNLSAMSSKQLRQRISELRRELSPLSKEIHPERWNKLNNELVATEKQFQKVKFGTQQTQGVMAGLKKFATNFLPVLSIGVFIDKIRDLGGELFNLTKQIQGETIRANTVLGDQMGYVENQADKLAAKMGVTNREFVSMVTNTADLLVPLDFSRKKAAEMASEVQGLSGALDEWTAGKYGVAEVSNILTKAMLGEMEQLKGLGIAIRQDSDEYRDLVKQKMQEENVTKAQASAMATLELIYKKSADAQAAYMLEGNKLLRWQKSVSLWFKQLKEDIATDWAGSMKTATQLYIDQQKEVDNLEKNLAPLIDQYDELASKKVPLAADEQNKLNGLITQISKIVPSAVTQWNDYGKALGISSEKVKELIEVQKAMLLVKNADAIAENEKNLERVKEKIKSISEILTTGHDVWGIGDYDGRFKKLAGELETLGNQRKGLEAFIKTLKGEPLVDPKTTEESTEAVTSLIAAQEDLLETAKKMPETTEAEIIAKNRKIKTIEEEIKRLKDLGIESKQSLKLSVLLEADAGKQQDAIRQYFKKSGKGAFEAFMSAFETALEQKSAMQSLLGKFDQEDEKEEFDPALSFQIKQYQQTLDYKEALLKAQYEKGLISEKAYQDKLNKLNAEGEKKRSAQKIAGTEKAQMFAQMGTNLVMSLMDMELEKAGDNEEKKKQIKKKYADINFVTAAAEIVANTAVSIMRGFAELGPIGGAIAAVLLGATGAIQLGIANEERKRVKGLKGGGFTDMMADEDEVVDVVHGKEWVASAPLTRNPAARRFIDVFEMAQRTNKVHQLNMPAIISAVTGGTGKQAGGYSSQPIPVAAQPVTNVTQPYTTSIDREFRDAIIGLNKKLSKPLLAKVSLLGDGGFKEAEEKLQKITDDLNL